MEEVTIEGVIMDNGSAGSTGIDPKKRTILIACISCLLAVCCGLGIAYGVGAFSPAAEEGDAGQEGAAPLPDTGELTVEEVRALCADLAFDGEALAVDADAISIEVKDGQVMVTEPTDALGAPVVGAAAKKSAALATALKGRASLVTWVMAAASDGTVQTAVATEPESAPGTGSLQAILTGSHGYVIADGQWAAMSEEERQGIQQSGGVAPASPSGTPIEAAKPAPPAASEDGGAAPSSPSEGAEGVPSGSPDGSNNAGTGGSSGGSQTSTGSTGQGAQVERPGHYEPTYESVWVPNVQYIRHERWQCSACGSMFYSGDAMDAHVWGTYGDAQHPNGASAIDQSYTEQVDNGHYEQRQTGQKWIVDVPGHWE